MRFKSTREKLAEDVVVWCAQAVLELGPAAAERGLEFEYDMARLHILAYHPADPRIRVGFTASTRLFSVYGYVAASGAFDTAAEACDRLLAENARYAAQLKAEYFIREMNLCD